MTEMRSVYFHGYTIYEDGTILGLHGKEFKKRNDNGRYKIGLNIEGKRINFTVARLVYHVFHPFNMDDKNLCVSYKDGNKLNIHLDNLYLTHRRNLIQGDKHMSRSKLSDEQVEEIRGLYKKSVNHHNKDGYSLQDLAVKYDVSKGNIAKIVRGESRNKDGYKLQ